MNKKENNKEEIHNIKESIEKNRESLNKKISENKENIQIQEILELSRKLDELIVEYHNIINEN